MKAVLMSIRPEWVKRIMFGLKTKEVRKRAPLTEHPYKVYVYCTKGGEEFRLTGVIGKIAPCKYNGTICGEFTCVSTTEYKEPWSASPGGSCMSARELYEYQGDADKLCFMAIENPILYDKPMSLEDFGLKRPPQSWQYVEVD